MKTQLLKSSAVILALFLSCTIYAQENYDFTALDCSTNKYSSANSTLTCDASGFLFDTFDNSFFESRINGVTTDGQNRVTINFTNNSNADGIFFKSSGTALEGGAVADLGATSVVYVFTDTNFTASGGNIQLRSRFINKAGDPLTGSVLLTSLVVDTGTLSVDDAFGRANTIVTVKDRQIVIKNAPEGTSLEIYNLLGQTVGNNKLSSGTYIVRLSAQDAVLTKKVLIL